MSFRVRCRALDVDLADVVNAALAADRDTDAILATSHDAARAGRLSPSPGNSRLRARLRLTYVKVQVSATL